MTIFFTRSFTTGDAVIAIPLNSIIRIEQSDNNISIIYRTVANETPEKFVDHIEIESVTYETPEIALDIMRNFYKDCYNNKGAFHF